MPLNARIKAMADRSIRSHLLAAAEAELEAERLDAVGNHEAAYVKWRDAWAQYDQADLLGRQLFGQNERDRMRADLGHTTADAVAIYRADLERAT